MATKTKHKTKNSNLLKLKFKTIRNVWMDGWMNNATDFIKIKGTSIVKDEHLVQTY